MKYLNVLMGITGVVCGYLYVITKNPVFIFPMSVSNGWCLGIFLNQLKEAK